MPPDLPLPRPSDIREELADDRPSPGVGRAGGSARPAAGWPGAIVAYFVGRLVVALMVALPWSAAVATVLGGYPQGDAALWDPGAILAFETSRLLEPAAPGLAWSSGVVALGGAFALLVPLAALLASMGPAPAAPHRRRGWGAFRWLLGRAARHLGALALLMGAALLIQALALGLWTLLGRLAIASLLRDPVLHDVMLLALALVGAVIVWLIGVVHDLARVGIVQRDLGGFDGVAFALQLVAGGLRAILLAAGWRALASATVVSAGLLALLALDCRSGAGLAALALVEVGALLAAVLLRVSWLGWAVRRAQQEPAPLFP